MVSKWLLLFLSLELVLLVGFVGAPSSSSVDAQNVGQQECSLETTINNDTSIQGDSSTGTDEENYYEDEDFTTEASYTPPLNHTFPAPKTAQGLGSDLGEPQDLDPTYSQMIFDRIEKAREYIHSKVMVEDMYKEVRQLCRNEHTACAFWSVLGECENNPAYMHVNCAPVCETCEVRIHSRCCEMIDHEVEVLVIAYVP